MKQEVARDQEAKRSNTKPNYSGMSQEEGRGSSVRPLNREGQAQRSRGGGDQGLGRKEKLGGDIGDVKGDRRKEGLSWVRLTGDKAKGTGDGNASSEPALDALKESPANRLDPLLVHIRIPVGAPRSKELLYLHMRD